MMNIRPIFLFASFAFSFSVAQAADAPSTSVLPAPPPPAPLPKVSVVKAPAEPVIILDNPRGIAVDKDGAIYIGDIGNAAVYKMTPAGKISLFAGASGKSNSADGVGQNAGFASPTGLAVDKDGNVYVADNDNNAIRKITPAGVVTTIAGKSGEAGGTDGKGVAARFSDSTGVAIDQNGNIFVADNHNAAVRKITPDGTVTTVAGQAAAGDQANGNTNAIKLNSARAITINRAGVIYVADEDLGIICKVESNSLLAIFAGSPNALTGSLDGVGAKAVIKTPRGLAADANGNLYVADTEEDIIRKITPDGTVTTLAGKINESGLIDGQGAAARFNGPRGLAVDKDGNVYVADSDNATIRKNHAGRSGDDAGQKFSGGRQSAQALNE